METNLTSFDKIALAKKGVSKEDLVAFKQRVNIDYDQLSKVLGTGKTTLQKKTGQDTFSPAISEKFIALMGVHRFGYQVFEDQDKFNKWIFTSNRSLGYCSPLELMDTIFGIDEVINLIGRIKHGTYS